MSLLSPAELKEHVETDLGTSALQRLLDDAEGDIVARYGENAAEVDDLTGDGQLLFLTRRAGSITAVTERIYQTDFVLASNDYILRFRGGAMERLVAGSNPRYRWAPRVRVEYVPVDDTARRKRVIIDLCRLAVAHTGLQLSRDGDHDQRQFDDYQGEREAIMSTLNAGARLYA